MQKWIAFFIWGAMGFTSVASVIKTIDETVRAAVQRTILNASDDVQSTARDTVREWTHRVEFVEVMTLERTWIEAHIKPDGEAVKIFQYVDLGTKGPYIIAPKTPGGRLRFQTGYSARTQPIAKYNQGTGQSFGAWVQAKSVMHPGIDARKFLETYLTDLIPSLVVRMTTEITTSLA